MSENEAKGNTMRPDAQAFDEVRIVTVPRYKTSGMSGDEWRISATIQFWRNGRMVHESGGLRNVETAMAFLPSEWHRAIDDGKAYFATEGDWCDQEGCAELAETVLRVKQRFCIGGGNCGSKLDSHGRETRRQFCARHVRRGDCDLEDADSNYETVSGPGLAGERPEPADEAPSSFGGAFTLGAEPQP